MTLLLDTHFIIWIVLGSRRLTLVRHALSLDWTRDPFDRLLAAHSTARRVPLCTADRHMLSHHRLLPLELRG